MTSLEKEHSSATRWQQLLEVSDPRLPAVAYLLYLSLAEALTVLVQVQAGVSLHLVGLFLLLLHTARAWDRPQHRFLLAMALVPLIRVVSLSLPLVGFPLVYWYLLTSIPLFAAVAVIMHLLGMDWRQAGWHGHVRHNWLWQPLVALSGLAIGAIEYFILRPQPLAGAFTWRELWLPALILLVSTGYLEELIFRRVMQRTAAEQLGPWRGIVYVAILFAVLHVGYLSLVDGLFVLLVGLLFGWVVHRTGSLVGVTLAHGLTNILLFLVMPFWAIGALQLPDMPQPRLPSFSFNFDGADESRTVLPGVGLPAHAEYLSTPWSYLPSGSTPQSTPEPTAESSPTNEPDPSIIAPTSTPRPNATGLPIVTGGPPPIAATATATGTPCGAPASWVPYTVQPGETLFSIGFLFGLTPADMQSANCLSTTGVYTGQILYVPFAAPNPTPTSETPTPTPTSTPEPSSTPQPSPTTGPPTATATSPPPTLTPPLPPTNTPIPPTASPIPSTASPIPLTATPTATSSPPSATATATPMPPTPTQTPTSSSPGFHTSLSRHTLHKNKNTVSSSRHGALSMLPFVVGTLVPISSLRSNHFAHTMGRRSIQHLHRLHHRNKHKAQQQRHNRNIQHAAQRLRPLARARRQNFLLYQKYEQRHHGKQSQRSRQRDAGHRRHSCSRYS